MIDWLASLVLVFVLGCLALVFACLAAFCWLVYALVRGIWQADSAPGRDLL